MTEPASRGRSAALRFQLALVAQVAACGAALAQSAPPATPQPPARSAPTSKPAARPVARPAGRTAEPAATPLAVAAAAELTDAQRDAAARAFTGSADCDLNQKVQLAPVEGQPGQFHLQHGKQRYLMQVQETSTGAVRLEDKRAGMVWLQIPAKSMLMNTKAGQRVADNCHHPQQLAGLQAAPGAGIGIVPAAPGAAAPMAVTPIATAPDAPMAAVPGAPRVAAPVAAAVEPSVAAAMPSPAASQ